MKQPPLNIASKGISQLVSMHMLHIHMVNPTVCSIYSRMRLFFIMAVERCLRSFGHFDSSEEGHWDSKAPKAVQDKFSGGSIIMKCKIRTVIMIMDFKCRFVIPIQVAYFGLNQTVSIELTLVNQN